MSLCFNWSCDFQRFTKSKKLSKFQVRTTTLFISNKSLSTSLFNLQGAIFLCLQRKIAPRVGFHREIRPRYMKCVSISSSKDIGSLSHRSFTRAFRALYFPVTAYSLYQIKFRLSRTFFDLFSRFSISSRRFRNFF